MVRQALTGSVSKVRDREALGHLALMGDHESDGLEYQDDEEEEEEDDEPVYDLTGGGALLSVQLALQFPGCTTQKS